MFTELLFDEGNFPIQRYYSKAGAAKTNHRVPSRTIGDRYALRYPDNMNFYCASTCNVLIEGKMSAKRYRQSERKAFFGQPTSS